MKRLIDQQLRDWNRRKGRKPLILQGARQVGKTYVVEKFGRKEFRELIKLDFLEDRTLVEFFATTQSLSAKNILEQLEIHTGRVINTQKDLLFFDEVQESPEAIKSLKYFCEQVPELALICAGSYLGVATNEASFPVGKVEYLAMGPLLFEEFLAESNSQLFKFYQKISTNDFDPIPKISHDALLDEWKTYMALGGLPEVLSTFFNARKKGQLQAFQAARDVQLQLLKGYRSDFAKHSGKNNSTHILSVFESISFQLQKYQDESVKRFKFQNVIPNQRGFSRVRGPLTWLMLAGLCIKTFIATKAAYPLKGYCEENKFKMYFFDIGLLQATLGIPMQAILSEKLGSYKGFIVENFIAQEMYHRYFQELYSWSEGEAELEFLHHQSGEIIPIEVKSSEKSRKAKSLDSFNKRYSPHVCYKFTAQNRGFHQERNILTIPLYLVSRYLGD